MDYKKFMEYLKSIDLTKAEGDSLRLSDEADSALAMLLNAEKFIADAKAELKERFLEAARRSPKLRSYEGDEVRVGYTTTRRKKIVGEPDKKFVVIQTRPDSKAIEIYREATGKLPEGIDEEAFDYINLRLVSAKEEVEDGK